MDDYRGYLFRGWLKARYSFEQAKNRCDIIAAASMVIWATLYALIVHLIGVPDFLKGKLIGVMVVLYLGTLFVGAGCFAVFVLLAKLTNLRNKNDLALKFKRALKDIRKEDERP